MDDSPSKTDELEPGDEPVPDEVGPPLVHESATRVARMTDPALRPHRRGTDGPSTVQPTSDASPSDRYLVRAAALGDQLAWDLLVARHIQGVWETCLIAGLATDEAASVCELVWLRLVDALTDLRGLPVRAWLISTAAREAGFARVRAQGHPAPLDDRRDRRRVARSG